MDNKIVKHDQICCEIHEMYKKKNADYGDSVGELYKKLGDISFLTRISDKYHRLMNLMTDYNGYMRTDVNINYESIDDTIQDLANYCIIWLMERELKKDTEKSSYRVGDLPTYTECYSPKVKCNDVDVSDLIVPRDFFDEE